MINGSVFYNSRGLVQNIRAMRMQAVLMGITNENVTGFDKVGYQRKIPVVSSFAEYLGEDAISAVTDDSVGRLVLTERPLDVALAEKGYFQIQTPEGVKLTRDGRFKMTKDGQILTLDNNKVLNNAGSPLVLPFVPADIEDISIDLNGSVMVLNHKTRKFEPAGTISVVTQEGIAVREPNVRQKYSEFSNVNLQSEFIEAIPYMQTFRANGQMYKIQNSNLQKAISALGS